MKLNEKKFKEFDFGAEYHRAWHEYEVGYPAYWNDAYMPKEYADGKTPEDVFKFIYECQGIVKDSIIRECCEADE